MPDAQGIRPESRLGHSGLDFRLRASPQPLRGSADGDVELDSGRGMLRGRHRELHSCAIDDTRRNGDLQMMVQYLGPAARAPFTRLGPAFATASAAPARTADGHRQRQGDSGLRVPGREAQGCAQRSRAFTGQERAPDSIHGRRHRREIDDDLIFEAASLVVIDRRCNRSRRTPPKRSKRVPPHDCWYHRGHPGRSQWPAKSARCAASGCACGNPRSPIACQAHHSPEQRRSVNGCARNAITSRK